LHSFATCRSSPLAHFIKQSFPNRLEVSFCVALTQISYPRTLCGSIPLSARPLLASSVRTRFTTFEATSRPFMQALFNSRGDSYARMAVTSALLNSLKDPLRAATSRTIFSIPRPGFPTQATFYALSIALTQYSRSCIILLGGLRRTPV